MHLNDPPAQLTTEELKRYDWKHIAKQIEHEIPNLITKLTRMTRSIFESQVALKYQLYNSLFLTLPIDEINNTGILIPILARKCVTGMAEGLNPKEILDAFFADRDQFQTETEELDFLFKVIQYVERQVVLLDALEDAAYNAIHDVDGPGSFAPFAEALKKDGSLADLQVALVENAIRIVLTAHPTQFYPGNVLAIITDLTEAIKPNDLDSIRLLLLQLGKNHLSLGKKSQRHMMKR